MSNSKRDRQRTRGGGHGPSARHRRVPPGRRGPQGTGSLWLFGSHAVAAALANPARKVRRVLVAGDPAEEGEAVAPPSIEGRGVAVEKVSRHELEALLPEGAVHQGIAAEVVPLPDTPIEDLCASAANSERAAIVVLDKVTDPRNVGAVLRSAAAFGACGLVMPERGAPPESGTLAKAASGALERVPIVRAVNLKRAMETMKTRGIWCVGFAADAATPLTDGPLPGRVALVLGAEGTGLRRLTRESCDLLVGIPIASDIDSLNVSAAAAVALYEWARQA